MVTWIDIFQDASFLAVVAFLAVYPGWKGRRTWYRSRDGRQLVAAYLIFALVLGLGVARNLLGLDWMTWAGRLWLALGVYVALTGVFLWQTVNAVLAWSRRRIRPPAAHGQSDSVGEV